MSWWNYLLLVNIYLVLFYSFYALLLRRETFFQLNRIYLVGAALLSFFIPMIQSDWIKDLFITQKVQYAVYGTADINITALAPIKDSPYTMGQLFVMLYVGGVVLLALRLMWQFILLRRIIKQASPTVPYSFFNKINVDEDAEGSDVILAHEEVHAKQWHSADVLIIEAVMIINWFNPVVYLYRFAIKHIHEYIADRQAIIAGTNKADYAMLLLSQTFSTPAHSLVNPFFSKSLLRERILMLQKDRSARIKLLKYGMSAPLFILMLVLSSATISNSRAVSSINNKAEWVFNRPADMLIPAEGQPEDAFKKQLRDADLAQLIQETKAAAIADTLNNGQIYLQVEQQPGFPGGDAAFGAYLARVVKYPKKARELNIQGRVILSFIVEKDGSLTDVKVVRGVGYGTDEEAVKALKNSPKWTPGTQNGKKVRVQYAVPISFSLAEEKTPVKTSATVDEIKIDPAPDNEVFTAVEEQPTFPGGQAALFNYIRSNIHYPAEARKNNIQGRVITSFVVGKDGKIFNAKVLRGIGYGADEEAVRLINAMPRWRPGIQNGRTVQVQYTIPILFSLTVENESPQVQLQGNTTPNKYTLESKDTTAKQQITFGLRGANDPVYILDGKEVYGLGNINPNTIESISVIRDKSAIIKYGAKGLNGVVLITSKKPVKK
ncbi:TonB family protein [Mucilaginibacter terrenus]|uniref:TonB family protein n=1 Tax=Mucilaginibacter terrenus TaxID=2482727 RepID=A0A3E2NL88_9SPHI|nr:M56 family metallopeptidase [Mucilaginibacter terrenus]RFZ81764.1 TonB family protein [Mucilaginibacter terrenus]